ncbi:phosphatidylglycerophosphatase B [Enterobacterales bacterium CwR94]|nr:phosphatidylglycerophosphatase B [Enterobacterales bacterium CwR94]
MLDIVKRTLPATLILLLIPALVGISGWQWQPGSDSRWMYMLFWTTETVTRPWGIVTSVILCGWFLWCLRFRLKPAVILLIILVSAVLAGQYAKAFIKEQVQEPRPYVLWLERTHHVQEDHFYQLDRQARGALVTQLVAADNTIPGWLKKHWAFETGFAFPSGHTFFAASWALLAVGILWPRRHFKTVVVLMVWASCVMGSRLVLGMHWPRDLIVATLLSWIFVTIATWFVVRFCGPLSIPPEEKAEIATRDHTP